MEADVSLTLEACVCVLFTMFCTFTLISCIVLVTSSIAEEVCRLFLADSSEALATCVEALATCDAASRTLRTIPRRPSTMRVKAFASVSFGERGWTSTDRLPPAMARSEEHTSELQSRLHLVCRLLLEKKTRHKRTQLGSVRSFHDVRLFTLLTAPTSNTTASEHAVSVHSLVAVSM